MPRARSRSITPDDPSNTDMAVLLRKIATLTKERDELKAGGKVKKDKISAFIAMGRGFFKLVHMFERIGTISQERDRRRELEMDGEEDEPVDEKEQKRRDELFTAWKRLVKYLPNITLTLSQTPALELTWFYNGIMHGAGLARNEDNSRLLSHTATWLNNLGATPLLQPNTRVGRGFTHELCFRLLCSIEWNCDDPEVRKLIRGGDERYHFSLSLYPRLFYENFTGDPNNLEKGCFSPKNDLLRKAVKCLFTSPSSSIEGGNATSSKATKGNIASRLHMDNKITPVSLAYTFIMLYFNLTEITQWTPVYNGLKLVKLYNFILAFFNTSDPTSRANANALLMEWNHTIFPDYYGMGSANLPAGAEDGSIDRLSAQRAARAAAAAAEA